MAINDIYEVVVDSNLEGQRCVNTFHMKEKTASDAAVPAQNLVIAIESTIIPVWVAAVSSSLIITSVYARRLFPTPGIPGQRLVPFVTGEGARSANCTPPQSCALISFYTSTASRKGRCRMYLSGIAEEDQDTGQLTDTQIARLQDLADILGTDLAYPGADPGVAIMCMWSPTDGVGRDIVQEVVRSNMATQRSRRAIYGPGGSGT